MSAKTVFISYRRDSSGRPFARLLEQALTHNGYDVFLDVRNIDSGKWADQILTEVPKRAHFLLLITPGALDRCADPDDWMRREFELAVRSGRNIVPVREESVDLDQLRKDYADSMKGLLDLQIPPIRHDAFESDVDELITRYIPTHKAPVAIAEPPRTTVSIDIDRIVKYAPADLIGRTDETKILNDTWDKVVRDEKPRAHILTFVALGGEGKTSLVAKWTAELAARDWPGCDAAFAWSFYSQGTREQVAASSDLFLKEALTFFGDDADKAFAASPAGAFEKGQRLARVVGQRRNLLILDGLEPLQYPPTSTAFKPGELKDQGVAKLLKDLATNSRGLCLVTTRYAMPDLDAFKGQTVREERLTRLSREHGVDLLKKLGVHGSERRNVPLQGGDETSEKVNEFEKLIEDVKGHALTLNLLATYLRDAHGGDIRKRDLVKLEEADTEEQGGHAFHVMDAYVRSFESEGKSGTRALEIWQLLGLFDRPMTADCFKALLKAPRLRSLTESVVGMTDAQRNLALSRLESARLLTVNRDAAGTMLSLDAHPLIREFFASRIRQNIGTWRAGHKRIYKHLISTTHEGDQPTLEDLQPLYQAVAHGCHAGLQQKALYDVYWNRIQHGDTHYAWHKLAAYGSELGAYASFFESMWSRTSLELKENEQAWLLNEAAFCLRALGRLTEAIEPMRAGLRMRIQQEVWKSAATISSNLSELELTLGEVASAVGHAGQSVTYADRSGDAANRVIVRTTHAHSLHQAGRRADAETRFHEAEQMQKELQPDYPLLYSMRGFLYCDLLLATPERAAWQATQTSGLRIQYSELIKTCRAVNERAAQTLEWEEGMREAPLLDLAIHHLTLGCAALYAAILTDSKLEAPNSELMQAVDGLRRAGSMDELPRGLLTRAWLRFLSGARTGPESAQEDLDEAWEIAERGPMRLHMADIHLYRARLFGGMKDEGGRMKYPWDKNSDGSPRGPLDDLDAAEKLINECGYHRRDEELADAKEAAKNW